MAWLKARQGRLPGGCSRVGAVSMPVGAGGDGQARLGGLGSMLQALVLKFAAGITLDPRPLTTRGHLRWYTDNPGCDGLNPRQRRPWGAGPDPAADPRPFGRQSLRAEADGWGCFFLPLSPPCTMTST